MKPFLSLITYSLIIIIVFSENSTCFIDIKNKKVSNAIDADYPSNDILKCSKYAPCVFDATIAQNVSNSSNNDKNFASYKIDWQRSLLSELRIIRVVFEAFEYSQKASDFKISPKFTNSHNSPYLTLKSKIFNSLFTDKRSRTYYFRSQKSALHLLIKSNKAYQIWIEESYDFEGILLALLGCIIVLKSETFAQSDIFLIILGASTGIVLASLFLLYYFHQNLKRGLRSVAFLAYGTTVLPVFLSKYLERKYGIQYNFIALFYLMICGIAGAFIAFIYGPIENRRLKSVFRILIIALGLGIVLINQSVAYFSISIASILLSSKILNTKFVSDYFKEIYSKLKSKTTISVIESSNKLPPITPPRSQNITRESLYKLRQQFADPNAENLELLSRLSKRESFIKFLKTGDDLQIDNSDLNEVSMTNIPAYELLSLDESE